MSTIQAKKRDKDQIGKKFSKAIRKNGDVPAIIYGAEKDSVEISLNAVDFLKQLNASDFKKNQIFDVVIDEKNTERVITKEISVNPLNNQFIHIDFLRVLDNKEVEVNVPITVEGISAGQRMGGVLVKPKSAVSLKCLPANIPVEIVVNVEKIKIGENVRAGELTIGEGQTLNSNPKDILVKVEATKVSKAAGGAEQATQDSAGDSSDGESAEGASEEAAE